MRRFVFFALLLLFALPAQLLSGATSVRALGSALAPRDIYASLLAAPFADNEFPNGFSGAKVSQGTLDPMTAMYNAIGQVNVDLSGPDAGDAIGYVIFADAAGARADFAAPPVVPANTQITDMFSLGGFAFPVLVYTAAVSDASGTPVGGLSICGVLVDTAVVVGISAQPGNVASGSTDNACLLAEAAVAHLQSINGTAPAPGGNS
ncbi:MAG: hypothetical protein ACR2PL_25630 [Dehalococcoidia bacterium]